ncbi:MAG: hypothetical protein CMP77_06245 [Flavobacterium sp.]|nr:hypothetical protein [Flavobacterium sp.]|tara:strand:+ start:24288 stop:25049 length:762 start_codon:yes stop_codon:yes gene_type:complete
MVLGCKGGSNSASEADVAKAIKKADEAKILMNDGKFEEAALKFEEAYKTNTDNFDYLMHAIESYNQKGEYEKSLNLLEKYSSDHTDSPVYFQLKAGVYQLMGDMKSAKQNIQKAYEVWEPIEINDLNNESDLMPLTGYAMLEAGAGYQQKALQRMNDALKLEWLSERNKEYLQQIRNEIEYYDSKSSTILEYTNDIIICTTNLDSLKAVLFKNHINVSGSSFKEKQAGKVYVAERFRRGIEKLNITPCQDSIQ